jgi:hypothetical protein
LNLATGFAEQKSADERNRVTLLTSEKTCLNMNAKKKVRV